MKTETFKGEMVAINTITVKENYRKSFDHVDVKELSESIKSNGVISPITVRPNGKAGKYELVCGERRLKASILAGLKDIPANIRELTDEQVLEIQINENLQRKDVSPMDEAAAYKQWQVKQGASIKHIADKVGKPEKYVARMLRLNCLIPDFQKALHAGRMKLKDAWHAILLSAEDQTELLENKNDDYYGDDEENAPIHITISDVSSYIQLLGEAPFDTKDPILLKTAGACGTCTYNTSVSVLLFPDEDTKDAVKNPRCLNGECFSKKCQISFAAEFKKVEQDTSIQMVSSSYHLSKEAEAINKKGHTILTNTQYSEASNQKNASKNHPTRAFCVDGDMKGKYLWIKINANQGAAKAFENKKENGNVEQVDLDQEIKRIQDTIKRGKELDEEKISPRIYDELNKLSPFFTNSAGLNKAELCGAIVILNVQYNEKFRKIINFSGHDNVNFWKHLNGQVVDTLVKWFHVGIRLTILKSTHTIQAHHCRPDNSTSALINESILSAYAYDKVEAIRKEQTEVLERRESKANARIKTLKYQMEELPADKPEKKAKKK